MDAGALLPLSVATPLLGAVLALRRTPRAARRVGLIASVATTATGIAAAAAVWRSGTFEHAVGGWSAPLGITLVADPLAGLMLGMTSLVGLAVSAYAADYFGDDESVRLFWALWLALWASLAALFLSADLFNVYVALELATLAAVGLVALARGDAVVAAFRYLLWALVGSLLFLAGVALLYAASGVLSFEALAGALAPAPATRIGAALLLAGVAVKGALFPLHVWLPPAHAGAPAPVSAALSALLVKAGFYLVLRLGAGALAPLDPSAALEAMGWLGAGAVVWGSALALVQLRLKLLVAYSTVAQLGYLYLALALGTPAAGVQLALSHAFAKAAMFLAAGTLLRGLGHDRIEGLAGAARRMPVTLFAFGLAGVSVLGLPPSGGFVGKWLLLQSALAAGHWAFAAVAVAGGLLAAGYVFRVLAPCFAPSSVERDPVRVGELVALGLAAASIALGFSAPSLLGPLLAGSPP